jgi:hypothetical protein
MKRWTWILVAIVIVVAAAAVLGWPRLRAAQTERAVAAVESIEDAAARAAGALALLGDRSDLCEDLWKRVFVAGLTGAREQGGRAAIEYCESVMRLELPAERQQTAAATLDGALLATGDPDDAARADDLAREAAAAGNHPAESYLRMVWQHAGNEMSDPWVAVELARAGLAAADSVSGDDWPLALQSAYAGVIDDAAMQRGVEGAYAVADSLIERANSPLVPGVLYSILYRLRVEDDPEAAVNMAQSLASLRGFTSGAILNAVAYDLAVRGLAPDLAVTLADAAIPLAASVYDSMGVLDTAGWANHRAGNRDAAFAHMAKAFSLLDETPSWTNEIVEHFVVVAEAAGKLDEAVDALALVVSGSVDPADPARGELARLLRKRDGSDAGMEALVQSKRETGREEAPAFSLADRGGATVDLASLRGKVVLIGFWSYG